MKDALCNEINAIQKDKTWELCDLPSEKNAIGVKWIFKTKYKHNGEVQKFKGRLVAKGYAQEYGLDYEEVFSLVARIDMIRILLLLAT